MRNDYGLEYEDHMFSVMNEKKQYKSVLILVHSKALTSDENYDFLDQADKEYISRIRNPEHKADVILGRFAAKKAVEELVLENMKDIMIDKGVFNQPVVVNNSPTNVQVSLAHTNNYGVAVSHIEGVIMGVDLEKTLSDKQKQSINLSEYEKEMIEKYQLDETIFWTAREALIKCLKVNIFFSAKLMELKNITLESDLVKGSFKHFSQYAFQACSYQDETIAIVYPANTQLDFRLNKLELLEGKK